jgi:hypothetical protein
MLAKISEYKMLPINGASKQRNLAKEAWYMCLLPQFIHAQND